MTKETGINFPTKSYEELIEIINQRIGKSKLFSILGIKNELEAELRSHLFDALYKGLMETVWQRQLSPLYEKLFGKKIKIVRKIDKKLPAFEIAFKIDEEIFRKTWIELCKEGILPLVFHYERLTVGALGWLKSQYRRDESDLGYYSTIFEIIGKKFDEKSIDIIFTNLFNILNNVGKEPEKFGILKNLSDQLEKNLKYFRSEKSEGLRYMMGLQLIHTYMDDEDICRIINQLISTEYIAPPNIRRLYERFPYSFSDWIITPYGVFKQSPSWLKSPNKKLAELLKREFSNTDQKYLEPELEPYKGSYSLRVLEYCIRENPEKILGIFGRGKLRKIAEELGVSAAHKIKNEEELIRLIILRLDFNLPPILSGIVEYNLFLDRCLKRLLKKESISGVMADVYSETERILQDLTYFYICYLWKISTKSKKPEELETEITNIVRELNVSNKPYTRITFGEKIKLIRTLNNKIRKNKNIKKILLDTFNRRHIIPNNQIKILEEISIHRASLFAHKKVKIRGKKNNYNKCNEIINNLILFSKILEEKKIYPHLIRLKFEITNEYGTKYFEAIDEYDNEWIVEYQWLDPSKPYFMYSKTKPVAIDPIIIEKIF